MDVFRCRWACLFSVQRAGRHVDASGKMSKTRKECSKKNVQLQKASSALSGPLGRVCCGMEFWMFTLLSELGRTCSNGRSACMGQRHHMTIVIIPCNLTITSSPKKWTMPFAPGFTPFTQSLAALQHRMHARDAF